LSPEESKHPVVGDGRTMLHDHGQLKPKEISMVQFRLRSHGIE
jgi:hypothetical protein